MAQTQIWDVTAPAPDWLREVFGRTVEHAWIIPPGTCLCLLLTGDKVILAESTPAIGDLRALGIEVADLKPGAGLVEELQGLPQSPVLQLVRGMRLEGMDGPVLTFVDVEGRRLGALLQLDGIDWLKEAVAG